MLRRASALRTVVVLIVAAACAIAAGFGLVRWWNEQELRPSTQDAMLDAHAVMIRPQVAGSVVAVHVRENQAVKEGDSLFEIDPRPFEEQLKEAQANLEV